LESPTPRSVGWSPSSWRRRGTLPEDQILEIVGLSDVQRDDARECILEAIERMVGPALPPDRS